MATFNTISGSELSALQERVRKEVKGLGSLEQAAQKYTDIFYETLREATVLVRLFATIPYGELPTAIQAFVDKLAASQGITDLVNDRMLVLTLLGTRGAAPAWNSRIQSKGHIGIPLASADFIDRIPMMSRLLKELGLDLSWIDSGDSDIVAKTFGKMAGVFYVPVAKTTVDHKGRLIIAAQDFVAAHKVTTVFGLGGGYLTSSTFITNIVFTSESVEKRRAESFMPLVNEFKTATMSLVSLGKIFS